LLFQIFNYENNLSAIGRYAQVCRRFLTVCDSTDPASPHMTLYRERFSAILPHLGGQTASSFHRKKWAELQVFSKREQLIFASAMGYERLIPRLLAEGADPCYSLICIEPGVPTPEITESPVEVLRTDIFNIDGRPHTALTAAISAARVDCVAILLQNPNLD